MSGHNRKIEILESRGKKTPVMVQGTVFEPPNQSGGCARSRLVEDQGKYKFVVSNSGKPCDSVTEWVAGGTLHSHQWSATGPSETDWMEGVVESHSWKLLGPPSPAAMVWNFGRAMAGAVRSGFKKAPDSVIESRLTVCRGCGYWQEDVRFGFGKCNHPQCGCTRAKLWVSSEKCPQGFWPAVVETEVLTLK